MPDPILLTVDLSCTIVPPNGHGRAGGAVDAGSRPPRDNHVRLVLTIEDATLGDSRSVNREALLAAVEEGLRSRRVRDRAETGPRSPRLHGLTAREIEVLELLTAGHSNKMTAKKLGISPRTVEFHRARLRKKTGATSLPDLVRLCLAEHGTASAAPRIDDRR